MSGIELPRRYNNFRFVRQPGWLMAWCSPTPTLSP